MVVHRPGAEAITVGDSLLAVWMSGASGNSMIQIGTSALSDLSVGMNADITPDVLNGNQNYPKIVGDDKLLAVAWQEVANSSRNVNLALSTKGPSGFSLYTPEQVNVNSKGVQQSPDIDYDGEYLHVVWQDITAQKLMYRRGKVDVTSSVASVDVNPFTVFPNPGSDQITIQLTHKHLSITDFILVDITGVVMEVTTQYEADKIFLNVENVTPGMYFTIFKIVRLQRKLNFWGQKLRESSC